MDLSGYVDSILIATASIDAGRKGFATRGMEQEGRISYEDGIALAMATFKKAQASADPQVLIVSEYTFITQEHSFCEKDDKEALSSLNKAILNFDDAFLALKAVENPCYKITDMTYPHSKDFRVDGFPKDAFHLAYNSHRARVKNILRSPGIDPLEKSLLKQRFENISTAQSSYTEKQKKMMTG